MGDLPHRDPYLAELRHLRRMVRRLAARQDLLTGAMARYLRSGPDPTGLNRETADFVVFVVGGETVPKGELEECAAVGDDDFGWEGSGVVIHPRLVLTAAHLQEDPSSTPPNVVKLRTIDASPPASLPIRATAAGHAPPEVIGAQFIPHPGFFQDPAKFDVAVMQLERASTAPVMQLASDAKILAATEVTIAGFSDNLGPKDLSALRKVSIPVQYMKGGHMGSSAGQAHGQLEDDDFQFAAGIPVAGACLGDSGGPAFLEDGQGNRKLVGIIHAVQERCDGFTILMRIDAQRQWIQEQLQAVGG
jgi:secreted trypsin-like serine protease